jgi:hypothetical protein
MIIPITLNIGLSIYIDMSKSISSLGMDILSMSWKELKKQRRKRKDSKYMPPAKVETHYETQTRTWIDGEALPEFTTQTRSSEDREGMEKTGWVSSEKILVEHYHWKKEKGYFSKAKMGAPKYMSVKISVKKSLIRLAGRGLINLHSISDTGEQLFTLSSVGIDFMAAQKSLIKPIGVAKAPGDVTTGGATEAYKVVPDINGDYCTMLQVPHGQLPKCVKDGKETYRWLTSCYDPQPLDDQYYPTEKDATEAMNAHCESCEVRKEKCWKPEMSEFTYNAAKVEAESNTKIHEMRLDAIAQQKAKIDRLKTKVAKDKAQNKLAEMEANLNNYDHHYESAEEYQVRLDVTIAEVHRTSFPRCQIGAARAAQVSTVPQPQPEPDKVEEDPDMIAMRATQEMHKNMSERYPTFCIARNQYVEPKVEPTQAGSSYSREEMLADAEEDRKFREDKPKIQEYVKKLFDGKQWMCPE